MKSIGEITRKKVKSSTTYTIVVKFGKKNIVIYGVKSFGKIKENANSMIVESQRGRYLIIDVYQSKVSRVVFAKAILIIMKNVKVREKIIKPVIDEAFKYFGKAREERNRTVVGENMGVLFLKDRYDFCNLKSRRKDTSR